MAIKQPEFKVIKQDGDIELREYKGYLMASVITSAENYSRAGSQGFSPLANYIFGNNQVSQKMPMTAPVLTTKTTVSKKIPMTAPVLTQGMTSSKYQISFVMPDDYKLSSLPTPINNDVVLHEIKKHRAVAISFKGLSGDRKVKEKVDALESWAKVHKIQLTGEPILARYDAPWKPGFLRHNEVIFICK